MTDPPGPRWPGDDENLSPEEAAELEEFLNSEFFAEMADDMLMDDVGQGNDTRTIHSGLSDDEEDLQDLLFDAQEAVLEKPIPDLVSVEEAAKIIAEGKKKYESKKQSEGEQQMPISDDAQQVAQIAGDETASQAMEGAINALAEAVGSMNAAASQLSTVGENMQAAGEMVANQASTAGGLLGGDEGQTISAQGQAVAQGISDALSKIANIDIAGVMENLQGVDLAQIQGQVVALREAIKAAAQKHQ